MPDPDSSATLITTRLVLAGRGPKFDRWADRVEAAVRASPGYMGGTRLEQPGGLVHFLHRFAGEDDLKRWTDSPERRALTKAADAFSRPRRQTATGAQPRFQLPSEATAPKWKTWVATWAAVFPMLLLLNAAIAALPFDLPEPVELAVSSLALTALLTWIILPRVRKLLRPWLFGDADGKLRREPG